MISLRPTLLPPLYSYYIGESI